VASVSKARHDTRTSSRLWDGIGWGRSRTCLPWLSGSIGSTDLIFTFGWLKEKVKAEDTLDNSEAREEQQQVHSMEQKHVALANLVVGE
jgi:hypothetical protein